MVIVLFYMLMAAATNGSLLCPEMAVCVLSNIALYQRYALKTSWQQCPKPYHVRGSPTSHCSCNSFNKWIKTSLLFMSRREILVLMTLNFRK